jgi:hypothetical protein
MSHLSFERLAALADEQPTADEHLHLSHCAECARELDAHRSLLAKAGTERESMGLPLTRWETLSRRLRAEGLIAGSGKRDAESASRDVRFPLPASRFPLTLQIAAALLLVAAGAVLGRVSAGASLVPGGLLGGEARQTASVGRASVDSLPTTFASIDEARRWKSSYEDAYQKTVSFLAANDSSGRAVQTPAVMRARLSALDRVQRTMGEALKDAPFDPVINNYYLNSFGEREATLRMLNTVLPQGVRMNSF